MAEKRRRLLDPCHSKVLGNITNLQIARTKFKLKVELRTLKKIIEEALPDGGDEDSVIVLPSNVYENPLDSVPNQFHEGISGHYGHYATGEQLRVFFGDTLAKPTTAAKANCTKVNEDSIQSEPKSTSDPVITDDDMELQNAIWNICPESNDGNKDMQMDSNEYLMETADQECVLFDLN